MQGPRYVETDSILNKFRERSFLIHKQKLDKIKARSIGKRRQLRKRNDVDIHLNRSTDDHEKPELILNNDYKDSVNQNTIAVEKDISDKAQDENNIINSRSQPSLTKTVSPSRIHFNSQSSQFLSNKHSLSRYVSTDDYSLFSMLKETKTKNFQYRMMQMKNDINHKNQILMNKLMAISMEKRHYSTHKPSQRLKSLNTVVRK